MNKSFETLQDLLNQNRDLVEVGTPANAELVEKAEQFLGVKFDQAFRKFLMTWGTLSFGPLEFYGLTGDDFGNSKIPDAIWFTQSNRAQAGLPQKFVAVFDNDGDELYCIDSHSKGAIVVWDVATRSVSRVKAPNILDLIYREASSFLS